MQMHIDEILIDNSRRLSHEIARNHRKERFHGVLSFFSFFFPFFQT